MRYIRLQALLWLLTLCIHASLFGQSNFRFQHFNPENGLAWNGYRKLYQDNQGFIWAQSSKGFSRFDGYSWKHYKLDSAKQNNLPSDFVIRGLITDKTGTIWTIRPDSKNGDELLMLDVSKDAFVTFKPTVDTLPLSIKKIFNDPELPQFWIGTLDGFYTFNTETYQTEIVFKFSDAPEMAEYFSILTDLHFRGEDLLISTRRGLWLFNIAEKKFRRPPCPAKDTTLVYHGDIYNIMYSEPDEIWLSIGRGGVVQLDSEYSEKRRRGDIREMMWTYYLKKDKAGQYYFGSPYFGLHHFNPLTDTWTYIKHDVKNPIALQSSLVTDILIDREQNLWITTSDKGISVRKKPEVDFYNFPASIVYGKNLERQQFSATSFLVYEANGKDYLLHALQSPEQPKLLELNVAPINYTNPSQLNFTQTTLPIPFEDNVSAIYPGKNYLWVTFFNAGTIGVPFNLNTGKLENRPTITVILDPSDPQSFDNAAVAIWEDPDENLWLGTDAGLFKVKPHPDGKNHRIENFRHDPNDSLSINFDQHYKFYTQSEYLWINTLAGIDRMENFSGNQKPIFRHIFLHGTTNTPFVATSGLLYVATESGVFETADKHPPFRFSKNEFIGDVHIDEIQEDQERRLWMTSKYGAMCYHPDTHTTISFNESNGLEYCYWINQKTSAGWMVTFGEEGFTLFNPNQLSINLEKITSVLTRLEVNHKTPQVGNRDAGFAIPQPINMLKELVLNYLHNNFAIEFSAMQMTDPNKNRYRYKLDGYDNDWIETSAQNRKAHYTNLNAGTYTFRVMASNHHGTWSDVETTLTVKILPPPWKTWWAYMGYALIIVGILYGAQRNIVNREKLNTSLQLREVELEKAHEIDRVKTAFFTNISHEFRTPLTLIKGPAQTLVEQATNKLDKDQLKTIQRNADLLLKLINQLLELARLESGTIFVKKTEENLTAFINAISSSFISLAEQKQILFTIHLPETHYRASLDFDKLETILINLISNALKFTPANGTVNITSECILATTGTSNLILTVSDTGMGIPEEMQSRIFERFYQVSHDHQQTGTGIGLALVKELTELLGGTIELKSTPGTGSEFKLTLPITLLGELSKEQAEEAMIQQAVQLPQVEAELQQELSTRPKILVVEDHADLRKFIIASMGDAYTFSEASDGKEGLARTQAEMPDLIISDVMMPGMDGIEMTSAIRKDIRISHTPVILLTAKASEEAKLTGLGMGADDYLTKPFDKSELNLKVRNSIARQATYREQARISMLKEIPRTEVLSADEQFLQKVKAIILAHLDDEKLSVEAVAGEVGMSRSQLFRKVTALTGSSVNELIRSFRLQKAAQLLDKKWGPVSQVAYEVGFSNLSYFSKCFKEQYGVLPSEYPK